MTSTRTKHYRADAADDKTACGRSVSEVLYVTTIHVRVTCKFCRLFIQVNAE